MIKKMNTRINIDKRDKITSGIKSEKGLPKSLDHFNIAEFPELQEAYGIKPDKLVLFFPSDRIEDFFDVNYVLYGNETKLRQCDGEECIHRINENVNGKSYQAGDISNCVCAELAENDKKRCSPAMYLKAWIADPKKKIVNNPLCYMFYSGSINSAENIHSELEKIKNLNMGVLRGIPFILSVEMIGGKDDAKKKFPIWNLQAVGMLDEIRERTKYSLVAGSSEISSHLQIEEAQEIQTAEIKDYSKEINRCQTKAELDDLWEKLTPEEQAKNKPKFTSIKLAIESEEKKNKDGRY